MACNLVTGFGSHLLVRATSTAAPYLTSAHRLRESRVRYTPGLAHANPSPGVAFKRIASLGWLRFDPDQEAGSLGPGARRGRLTDPADSTPRARRD